LNIQKGLVALHEKKQDRHEVFFNGNYIGRKKKHPNYGLNFMMLNKNEGCEKRYKSC
jgi:hypothetical protein